jgi:DNA repair exonuclease SbcCD ATPase subunit
MNAKEAAKIDLFKKIEAAEALRPELLNVSSEIDSCAFVPDPIKEKLVDLQIKLTGEVSAKRAAVEQSVNLFKIELKSRAQVKVSEAQAIVAAANETYRNSLTAIENQIADAVKEVSIKTQEIADARGEIDKSRKELAAIEQRNALVEQTYTLMSQRHETSKARLAGYQEQVRITETEWKKHSDYLELLKGFRNKIFDETLEELGHTATDILGNLPNASHLAIEFSSTYETSVGTTKEAIKPLVYVNGIERKIKGSVSGGQMTSLALATDLAIAEVIGRRQGCNLAWIALDESFEGHDTTTKKACLEMLSGCASDRLVLVVDHASEFQSIVTQKIVVEFKNQQSHIVEVSK